MDKIFIFIIIMIITSMISKNRKKKESQRFEEKPTQNNSNPKNRNAPQPVTDLRELLKTLKNINPEANGSKTFSDMKNHAEQVKPAGDNEYSKKDNYEETASYEEPVKETYSYDTAERNYDSTSKSYDEVPANQEKSANYDENKDNYMTSVRRTPIEDNSRSVKPQLHPRISLFDSKSGIRNGIIAAEILKRKYT